MPRKKSYITVKDQFCGSGGSSQGAKAAGAEVRVAMNHWKLAIETHSTNFPDTMHDCTDISASDPRRYPSTDILITSPECTNHSLAKGKKILKKQMDLFASGKMDPAAERSRATMWDVPRFAEYHNYNGVIVENVVDARKWVMFDAWLKAMHSLGYMHKCVYRNSMHFHPTPQSRDRMYVVFWKRGNKAPDLNYMPLANCQKCCKNVNAIQSWKPDQKSFKYKTGYQYCCPTCSTVVEPYYYAAFNCIDWSDIGKKIGDREKPLSPNTIKRINYGIDKFGGQPLQIVNYTPGYTKTLGEATATITTRDSCGLLTPFVINDQHSTGIDFRVRGMGDILNTVTTTPHFKIIQPFILKAEHSNQTNVRGSMFPFQTQTTRQSMGLICDPLLIEMNRTGKAKPLTQPTSTFTAGGINHALAVPVIPIARGKSMSISAFDALNTVSAGGIHSGILTTDQWNSFIAYNYNGNQISHISEACDTVTTKERMSLLSYQKPSVEDCYYRMLKPHEIQLAMAFDKNYVVLGSGKDKVRQLGNAVTPPVMEWLVRQVIASLK